MTVRRANDMIAEVWKLNRDPDRHQQLSLWREFLARQPEDNFLDVMQAETVSSLVGALRREQEASR